jgi:hypothetical protein
MTGKAEGAAGFWKAGRCALSCKIVLVSDDPMSHSTSCYEDRGITVEFTAVGSVSTASEM